MWTNDCLITVGNKKNEEENSLLRMNIKNVRAKFNKTTLDEKKIRKY